MVRVPLSLISWGTSAAAALSTEVLTSLPFLSLPLSSELEPQPARAIEATIRVAATREVLRMRVLPDDETGIVRHPATGPASRRGPGRGCDALVTRGGTQPSSNASRTAWSIVCFGPVNQFLADTFHQMARMISVPKVSTGA